jgi:hypothetical protein
MPISIWCLNATYSPTPRHFYFNNVSSSSTYSLGDSLNSPTSVGLSNVSGCFQPDQGFFAAQKYPEKYHFNIRVAEHVYIWLYPKYDGYNVTGYGMNLFVRLKGLAKTVQPQINIGIFRGSSSEAV